MNETKSSYRVLLIVPFTLPEYSGSGLNAFSFARFLSREGNRTRVLTLNRNIKRKRLEVIEDVALRRIAYFNRNTLTKILSLFLIFPAYIREIVHHDVIIIYGAHLIGYQLLICWSRIFGKKVVFQSLLLGEDDMETLILKHKGLLRQFSRYIFRRINLYHAINPQFEKKFRQYIGGGKPVLVNPQGYDPDYFHPVSRNLRDELRNNLGISPDSLIILSVGFIIPRKGYKELLSLLSEVDLDFQMYLIGEFRFSNDHFLTAHSGEADQIIEFGKKVLGDKLVLTGPVNCVHEYLQLADIFILNSQQEGLPNVILEAMACGCAVICRDLPGFNGYVLNHGKTGLIYRDNEELKSEILQLGTNPEIREGLGRNAAEFISDIAAFKIVWNKLLKLLYQPREQS